MRTEPGRSVEKRSTRAKAENLEVCILCGVTIERFDREVFIVTRRCAPCHEAVKEN
jgi:hypothetical protein